MSSRLRYHPLSGLRAGQTIPILEPHGHAQQTQKDLRRISSAFLDHCWRTLYRFHREHLPYTLFRAVFHTEI